MEYDHIFCHIRFTIPVQISQNVFSSYNLLTDQSSATLHRMGLSKPGVTVFFLHDAYRDPSESVSPLLTLNLFAVLWRGDCAGEKGGSWASLKWRARERSLLPTYLSTYRIYLHPTPRYLPTKFNLNSKLS